ncbi:peptidoglycan D,D-transpeptidase FtsI family protein [Psychrobacter sp. FDAARGOS_221]|uniref:peptidoglycan D,D-transpeptidase FtsI family protein n=1 Tax=Psychrobacter sp. FDAARGOS_221 TaxID=1975705 RepID=UPI000BB58BCF|nr:penicillin-binding protein 2 [Psychrobacter sp. FDAARGOS_221]PNK60606.1 penicillin-binding protein 2 [Psychrobacter sp. FDAARGOS_221]
MSKKPSDSANKKSRQTKKTAANKPMHGKVTEPLVPPKKSASKSSANSKKTASKRSKTSKSNPQSNKQGLAKLKFWKKAENDQVYTSVKHRKGKRFQIFKSTGVGAYSRGSAETDLSRFKLMWAIACMLFLALVCRAFYLQVINADELIAKGDEIITSERIQRSYRGMITDRNHQPLAVSAPLASVTFSPYDYALAYYDLQKRLRRNSDDPEATKRLQDKLDQMDLAQLSNVSGVSLDRLQQAVALDHTVDVTDDDAVKKVLPSGSGSHYLPLLNKVTPEIADAVMALNFPGVHEKQEFRRYYPQPQPSAQLLGFMGYNANDPNSGYEGRAGIERQYQVKLAGEDGKVRVLKDRYQHSIEELEQIKPVVPGEDVVLSIDSRLQYLLYKELERVGRVQEARWSTGMVVDVHTGEVLALSTWPAFNNNNLNEMTGNNQRNRALLDVFEPGSVMKPFTVATALESGKYTENSLINTSPGSIRVKGYTIRDHSNLGSINMSKLIQKSSNVASTKIALSLPPDAITNMQKSFGFGSKTALEFPGEQAGIVPTPKENETSRRATVSYGYGLQVTLAQITQAYAALGSGGVLHPLTLIKQDKKVEGKRIIDEKNAMAVVKMMETVTQPGGTGTAAAIDGYRIAGKTGTSRRVNPDGGYYTDQYRTVFAGVAPASNPRLAAVILVEDPRKAHYAGIVAAPVFKSVMQEALRLYNVPLDKPLTSK